MVYTQKRLSLLLILISCLMTSKAQDSLSIQLIEDSLSNASTDLERARFHNTLGSMLLQNDPVNAQRHWKNTLRICSKNHKNTKAPQLKKYKKAKAQALSGLGVIERRLGNSTEALDYYHQSLKIALEIGDSSRIGGTYFNIGTLHRKQKDIDKALTNYRKSLSIRSKLSEPDTVGIINCYNAIGISWRKKDNLDSAFFYYNRSLNLSKSVEDPDGVLMAYSNLGVLMTLRKETDLAKVYYDSSYTIARSIGNKRAIATYYTNIAGIMQVKQRLDSALFYIKKGIALYQETKSANGQASNYMRASKIFEKQSKPDSALVYLKKHYQIKQEIFNEKNTKELAEKSLQFEFDQEKLKLELERQAERRQARIINYATLGGIVLLVIIVIITLIAYRNKKRDNIIIAKEKARSEELLLNILPEETAEELKTSGHAVPRSYEMVSVLFTDFKGFTRISEKLTPEELVAEIDVCFKKFDQIAEKYGIEKIKTIGDAYMAAGGLPVANTTNAEDVINAALEIRDFMLGYKQRKGDNGFEIRIGVHTGPVVAGIVGIKKFAYDIWGDTVNTASRMESSGAPGKVNVSGYTHELVKDKFTFEHRGKIAAKNKGEIDMYFVERKAQ